ncbi:TetR/AcrR family transcriptional regulator [Nocardia sp. NPDC050406]|uniref:TetR/AcrR family transcriptional regulator n=1 Tax=Nocardia sp. NPDC050406 TaxID=3364318 RepID=UPI0037886C28
MGDAEVGLRELKKERTRRALLRAAYRLFDDKGYDGTTITEIAKAAEVSPGTFFNYFGTKEDLLFADRSHIVEAGLRELGERHPGETPGDMVLRAYEAMLAVERTGDPDGELGPHRARLVLTVPALHATSLKRLFDVQQRMAVELHRTCADELDEIEAAVIVGAFTGAGIAALRAAIEAELPLEPALRRALDSVGRRFHGS